jgi:hypothetical protein
MSNLTKFFTEGLRNTILLRNNSGFSHKGSWILANPNTVLDRWYIGDFCAVEYTISSEYDSRNRELIKCLITAGIDNADLQVYSRSATKQDLIDIEAVVTNSYVEVIVFPKKPILKATKVIFTAQYFEAQNPLVS